MSLFNGNGMKATGRSSSQRSIYDYPEHLNPFYEDENHKRIRFWKLGFDDKKSSRSNSFSIDNLKGLWSFKSFKLKKKSSTLGINKTSESPPMLRRDDDQYGSQATIDSGIRHTVDVGLANNFQRGAGYRCSLQDLNSRQGDVFFVRNHRYRSTAQPGTSKANSYQSNTTIGPITPTFRSKFNQANLSRGSSQISVNSGNPFEDDYETISQVGSPERASIRRSGRKKRRAPQPPLSPAQMSTKTITTVEETSGEGDKNDETVNITNLTAEIESFVRTADTDKENIENVLHSELRIEEDERPTNEEKSTSRQSPESNDYYPQEEQIDMVTLEKIQNLGSKDMDVSNNSERCKRSPVKILIRAPTDEEPMSEEAENIHETKDTERETVIVQREQITKSNENNTEITANQSTDVASNQQTVNQQTIEVSIKPSTEDSIQSTTVEQPDISNETVINVIHTEPLNDIAEIDEDASNTTPTSAAVEFILENDTSVIDETNLRITESTDDLSNQTKTKSLDETEEVQLRPKISIDITKSKESETSHPIRSPAEEKSNFLRNFDIRTVPLKLDSPSATKKNDFNDKTGKKIPPTPPQRRRSVKDIIDSINKCQSLLKINQNPNKNKAEKEKINLAQASSSSSSSSAKLFNQKNSLIDRNMNDLAGKQYQEKRMFSDIAEVNNNGDTINIPLFVEKFDEFNNNNTSNGIVFEKCVVRGDRRKSNDEKMSNVEWNPVPKPRRHRHSQQGSIN